MAAMEGSGAQGHSAAVGLSRIERSAVASAVIFPSQCTLCALLGTILIWQERSQVFDGFNLGRERRKLTGK
jgi:hypothetical protein